MIDCNHPGFIEHGRVLIVNGTTTYNSAIEYHCIAQYERIGPYLRKCLDTGEWSGEEPRCQSMFFSLFNFCEHLKDRNREFFAKKMSENYYSN